MFFSKPKERLQIFKNENFAMVSIPKQTEEIMVIKNKHSLFNCKTALFILSIHQFRFIFSINNVKHESVTCPKTIFFLKL